MLLLNSLMDYMEDTRIISYLIRKLKFLLPLYLTEALKWLK